MLDASEPNSVSMKMEARCSSERSEKHYTTLHDTYEKEEHDLSISHHKKLINNNSMLLTHL
jgi:hypothetical protein